MSTDTDTDTSPTADGVHVDANGDRYDPILVPIAVISNPAIADTVHPLIEATAETMMGGEVCVYNPDPDRQYDEWVLAEDGSASVSVVDHR